MTRRNNRKQREKAAAARSAHHPAAERLAPDAGGPAPEAKRDLPAEPSAVRHEAASRAAGRTEGPRPPARTRQRRQPFLTAVAGAFVAAIAVLAYANSTTNVTVHDDAFFVPARHDLSASSIAQIFREDTWASTGSPAGTYRPLTILSIAVNGAMFGRDASGYHATNVVLHAVASVLVFLLLLELLGAAHAWPAALAAAVFAVHPIHTEAVDSVFNRSEVLATAGVVGALWVIRRWHEERAVVAWGVAAVLYLVALLCRESAVTLPALAVLMLWFVHDREPALARLRRMLPVAVLLIPLAEYFVLRQYGLATAVQAEAPVLGVETEQDLLSRVAYSAAALREYARMMVWPWPLRMSYENFSGDGVAVTAVVHAGLVAGAIAARRAAPLVPFAIALFYVALLPSTRLFTALGESLQLGGAVLLRLQNTLLVAERVAYLPSVALAILLAVGLAEIARRRGIALAAACAALPIVAGLVVTIERNRQWQSAVELFAADVEAAPENGDGWRLYVSALSNAERHEDAANACDSQLGLPGRSAQLFNNCGVTYDRLGRDEQAIQAYTGAIEQGLVTVGHANRGRVYARMGRMAEAESEFIAAAESENDPARRHYRNGLTLARFHPDRRADARREFEAALALQPDYGAAREALGRLGR